MPRRRSPWRWPDGKRMSQMVEDARAAMPLYDTTSIHAEAAVSLALA